MIRASDHNLPERLDGAARAVLLLTTAFQQPADLSCNTSAKLWGKEAVAGACAGVTGTLLGMIIHPQVCKDEHLHTAL